MFLKNQKILLITLSVLIVVSISVSFIVVVTASDIKGTQIIDNSNWDVHFEKLENPVLTGNALEITRPYITNNATSLTNFDFQFSSIYDSILYTFDVINMGGLDAEVSSIQISNPICKGILSNSEQDASVACESIKIDLTYSDGTKISKGDVLKSKENRTLNLKISYKGSKLPLNDVDISNLNIAIIYSQY